MATLTEAQQLAFSLWMKDMLKENKTEIEETALRKKGIKFDTDGYLKSLTDKEAVYQGDEGKIVKTKSLLQEQNKTANIHLGEFYKVSSDAVEAVVGAIGKDEKLSKILRNKRDSMVNEAARGGSDTPENNNPRA